MNDYLERIKRKKALKKDLIIQMKKHSEWETIGVPEGTQVSNQEKCEVLKELIKSHSND